MKRSGTISNFTMFNPPTNQPDEVADGAHDWTLDELQMIEVQTSATITYQGNVVTGPTRGWIAKHLTGPNQARSSIMCSQQFTPPNRFQGVWPGPVPVGATYTVLQLPKVWQFYIDARLQQDFVNRLSPHYVELLDIKVNFAGPKLTIPILSNWLVYDCSLDYIYAFNGGNFCNCMARTAIVWEGYAGTVFGMAAPGCFITGRRRLQLLWPDDAGTRDDRLRRWGDRLRQRAHPAKSPCELRSEHFRLRLAHPHREQRIAVEREASIWGQNITTYVLALKQGGNAVDNNQYGVARPYCTAAGPSDILLNGHTSLPAMNPTTYALSAPIPLTFANLFKSFANGGFEGIAFDPRSASTRYEFNSPGS